MDAVIGNMSREKLLGLASILKLHDSGDPGSVTRTHARAAEGKSAEEPFRDLQMPEMRREIKKEISTAGGHTIANLFRGGKGVPYREIVWDVASHVKVKLSPVDTIATAEGKIAAKQLKIILEKLTEEQRRELAENLEREAKKHGKSFTKEGGALAALTAAQLSGFGVYLAASTIVGAITSFLGFTLPFAFYTTMSSVISVVIGPIGWAGLGIAAVYKVGSPNVKKLLPAVLFIAAERNAPQE